MNHARAAVLPGALCALALAFSSAAFGADTAKTLSDPDRDFVKEAARGNETEVKFGQIAANKAESSAVREFAQRMVDDHGKANAKLKDIAQKDGFDIPTSPDPEEMQEIERLQKLSGKDFDRTYMKIMLKDHERDVAEFKKHAKEASNPDVKQWAETTLHTIEQHLAKARSTAKSVGAS